MEHAIITGIGLAVFFIGWSIGRTTGSFTIEPYASMYDLERRKWEEAEYRLYRHEEQVCRFGCPSSLHQEIILKNQYQKGYYDGQKDTFADKVSFATIDQTKKMHRRLVEALEPLHKLEKELYL